MDLSTYKTIRQFADTASDTEISNAIGIIHVESHRRENDDDFGVVARRALSVLGEELQARQELAAIRSAGNYRLQ